MPQLLTIGRFARLSGLSIKMLRRYDEQALLSPAHVDGTTGYRYYTPAQVETAAQIKLLRGLELPLAEIRSYLALEEGPRRRAFLEAHRGLLETRLAQGADQLQTLQQLLNGAEAQDGYPISLRQIPERRLAYVRQRVDEDTLKTFVGASFLTLYRAVMSAGVTPEGPGMSLFHDRTEEGQDVEVAVPLPPSAPALEVATRIAGPHQAAETLHRGAYEELPRAYRALQRWAEERGLTLSEPLCHLYEVSPAQTREVAQLRTLVQWPLAAVFQW